MEDCKYIDDDRFQWLAQDIKTQEPELFIDNKWNQKINKRYQKYNQKGDEDNIVSDTVYCLLSTLNYIIKEDHPSDIFSFIKEYTENNIKDYKKNYVPNILLVLKDNKKHILNIMSNENGIPHISKIDLENEDGIIEALSFLLDKDHNMINNSDYSKIYKNKDNYDELKKLIREYISREKLKKVF